MKGIKRNDLLPIIVSAITEMEVIQGEFLSIDQIIVAELGRCIGLSRSKLCRLKVNGFQTISCKASLPKTEHILDGFSAVQDSMLRNGVSNSVVCHKCLQEMEFT
ncbi:MAG: hypothetical protein ACOXZM_09670 [Eubacteriales bacterium]|jgi:hypothetical protein